MCVCVYAHSIPTCVKLELRRNLRNLVHIQLKADGVFVKQLAKLLFFCNGSWVSVWSNSVREMTMSAN